MSVAQAITNGLQRGLSRMLPGVFGPGHLLGMQTKHDHYGDYGWEERPQFEHFFRMYQRNGLATAAVDKTTAKTWEKHPALWEKSEQPKETPLEKQIRLRFAKLRIWQELMNVDRRSMVGRYSAAIIRVADSQALDQPVGRVPGGINGLAGIIPVWESQLKVTLWDNNQSSETYGSPLMYEYLDLEPGSADAATSPRQIKVHPDRVLIWSEDGTIHGRSMLEPGYNDLIDAEKVKGAGGEGFWKSARGAPIIEARDGLSMSEVMQSLGTETADDALDAINEQLARFNEGFDKGLMLGGLTAKPLQISLPQPEQFFDIAVKGFAASFQIPLRILLGNETGERASTEDATGWAQVNMSRRENLCLPALYELVERLVRWGILPPADWTIGWPSLLDATPDQLLDRAAKMQQMNAQAGPGGEPPFLQEEIREAAGFKPMSPADLPETTEPVAAPEDDEVTE